MQTLINHNQQSIFVPLSLTLKAMQRKAEGLEEKKTL